MSKIAGWWSKYQEWMNGPFLGGSVSFWVATGMIAWKIIEVFT